MSSRHEPNGELRGGKALSDGLALVCLVIELPTCLDDYITTLHGKSVTKNTELTQVRFSCLKNTRLCKVIALQLQLGHQGDM